MINPEIISVRKAIQDALAKVLVLVPMLERTTFLLKLSECLYDQEITRFFTHLIISSYILDMEVIDNIKATESALKEGLRVLPREEFESLVANARTKPRVD